MNSPVEQIKERLSIIDVVSSYIKLERAGANWKANCPFHNEKTPSFFVSPERGSYYCFGCGAKGDAFSFIEEFEGLDFKGALKLLAERAGVPLENYRQENKSEKEKLYQAMERSTLFFSKNLEEQQEVREYLKNRGVLDETIERFRIGFAGASWDALYKHLKENGFSDKEIELAGLAKLGERGYYDRFRERIIFPISDSSGRVIAFSGRIFGSSLKEGEVAKYLNSPETPLFNKSMVLYGIDKAKDAIRKNDFSILVEGQIDLILSHQAGFRNTVATSGTALSENASVKEEAVSNLVLARRLSQNIVLAFDGDPAGFKAVGRAGKIALYLGMDVKVADIPEGKDPADLIATLGISAWKAAIRGSKHVIDFILEKILKEERDLRKVGIRVREELLPYVAILPSAIEKNHFLKRISQESEISEGALIEDLKKVVDASKQEREEITKIEESSGKLFRLDHIQRRILGIIFWQESLPKPSIDLARVKASLKQIFPEDFEKIFEDGVKDESDLIFEAEVFYQVEKDLERDLEELLSNLSLEYLKEELSKKMRELRIAEEAKNSARSEEILKECQIISQKIEEIKSGRFKK